MKYIKEVATRQNIVVQGTPVVAYVRSEDKIVYVDGDPILANFVDMGLPSGTLWAKKNLGASDEKEVGEFFFFGETEGYSENELQGLNHHSPFDEWSYAIWAQENKSTYEDKWANNAISDTLNAAKVLGDPSWDIPDMEEWEELNNNVTWREAEYNGKTVLIATSNINGNELILTYGRFHTKRMDYNDWYGGTVSANITTNGIYSSEGSFSSAYPIRPIKKVSVQQENNGGNE